MASSPVKKVGMIILLQHDLNAGVEFYKTMGFKLKFHLKDKWAEFELGDVKVGLCPVSKELPDRRTGIVLEVESLKKSFEDMKNDVAFLSDPYEAVHGIMVSFKDPGGNVLDLYEPTPERVAELVKNATKEGGCCAGELSTCACAKDPGKA